MTDSRTDPRLSIYADPVLIEAVRRAAEFEERSVSSWIRRAINAALRERAAS